MQRRVDLQRALRPGLQDCELFLRRDGQPNEAGQPVKGRGESCTAMRHEIPQSKHSSRLLRRWQRALLSFPTSWLQSCGRRWMHACWAIRPVTSTCHLWWAQLQAWAAGQVSDLRFQQKANILLLQWAEASTGLTKRISILAEHR